jgi:hypothetical protein
VTNSYEPSCLGGTGLACRIKMKTAFAPIMQRFHSSAPHG